MMICDNLRTIGQQLREAEARYQRPAGSVQLLAVSKRHPVSALQAALGCGQRAFGENYVQEMVEKAEALPGQGIEWHFIGPIQSNKTRLIAQTASWIHSVERLKVAQRLSEQRAAEAPPLNICLQVNISAEDSKSGLAPEQVSVLAHQVAVLPGLRLRGLMCIPAPETDFARQRAVFARLRQLQEQLVSEGLLLDTLSMGMSADMEAAVAEGATLVRIGTAIFGARE
ncbi:MAG: YggS family pyridoxal phosphate-dependent enzyme [Thiothrix sp.]|nr:YggS family pyridoxal phosphate-dependent enzyme [Thiothrix sp.]HPE60944.1 YggS family pyridoxal phosphate-dependent enzyme [Thiolinea sp.]